jgi:hypothetical protein
MYLCNRLLSGVVVLALVSAGCGGGGGSPSGPTPAKEPGRSAGVATSDATPTPTRTPDPVVTAAPWMPPGLEGCALGVGSIHGTCGRQVPQLLTSIDAAIESVAAARPDLVNITDQAAPGGYLVLNRDEFFANVLTTLRASGVCADYDDTGLQVKSTNDFSEAYDVLSSSNHLRRGNGSYRETCNPAAFPVDPQQIINRVRVGFYSMRCGNRTTPGLNSGLIPVGCTAMVTASPKDIHDDDIPGRLHGPDIAWDLRQDGLIVDIYDIPENAFNKNLEAFSLGPFRLCATVQEIEGCLVGEVIP